MVSTRNLSNDRMNEVEQKTLLLSLQREMSEIRKKNEEEIRVLRKENEEMKRQLTLNNSIEKPPSDTKVSQQEENLEELSITT